MVFEDIVAGSAESLIKGLTRTIAALGGIIFLSLVFNAVNLYFNRKRVNVLNEMNGKLDKIFSLVNKKRK